MFEDCVERLGRVWIAEARLEVDCALRFPAQICYNNLQMADLVNRYVWVNLTFDFLKQAQKMTTGLPRYSFFQGFGHGFQI